MIESIYIYIGSSIYTPKYKIIFQEVKFKIQSQDHDSIKFKFVVLTLVEILAKWQK